MSHDVQSSQLLDGKSVSVNLSDRNTLKTPEEQFVVQQQTPCGAMTSVSFNSDTCSSTYLCASRKVFPVSPEDFFPHVLSGPPSSVPAQDPNSLFVLQMRVVCKDVKAETLYDVLHDTSYRRKWDTNMIDTYDIGRLTANADIGYYSCSLNEK